jgi:hypothetical protein
MFQNHGPFALAAVLQHLCLVGQVENLRAGWQLGWQLAPAQKDDFFLTRLHQ